MTCFDFQSACASTKSMPCFALLLSLFHGSNSNSTMPILRIHPRLVQAAPRPRAFTRSASNSNQCYLKRVWFSHLDQKRLTQPPLQRRKTDPPEAVFDGKKIKLVSGSRSFGFARDKLHQVAAAIASQHPQFARGIFCACI